MRKPKLEDLIETATRDMRRSNSEAALQTAIGSMLRAFPTADVIAKLRAWASYLEERK